MVKRGEIYWVNLDPTIGTEIKKTRPGLVVSPNDLNRALPRVIIAPITSKGQPLACRPEIHLEGKHAKILLDQIRCIDKTRLGKRLGEVDESLWHPLLMEMLE